MFNLSEGIKRDGTGVPMCLRRVPPDITLSIGIVWGIV